MKFDFMHIDDALKAVIAKAGFQRIKSATKTGREESANGIMERDWTMDIMERD